MAPSKKTKQLQALFGIYTIRNSAKILESLFRIGDIVKFNSGGHNYCVVDVEGDDITISWTKDGVVGEGTYPAACFDRVDISG